MSRAAEQRPATVRRRPAVRQVTPTGGRTGLIDWLLGSSEPSIRLMVAQDTAGAGRDRIRVLRRAVAASDRVTTLLSGRAADGRIPGHPYRAKWTGAHWVLVTLAELGYPAGDPDLIPLREQVLSWLFSPAYLDSLGSVHGLPRLHGSIEGNALWAMLRLGLADDRADLLAHRLRTSQWPDGGWNCDRRATGHTSSFHESLIPLRALALHDRMRSDAASAAAAAAAAELFLRRRLYRRMRNGRVMHPGFVQLHYPCYWHYDVLFGLAVLAETGHIRDPRCGSALDLLESKRLPDGGFPAEQRFYRPATASARSQVSLVDWGGVSKTHANVWVSARAATVLHRAGRPVERPPA